jgi:hypothetical protein
MTHSYTAPWRKLALAAMLGLAGTTAAQAQFLNYPPALASNTALTYTDLGTTGTAISVTDTDDALSAPQNIGFTFSYNGTDFTQFILSTNGFIKLGSTPLLDPAEVSPLFSADPADANIIAAMSNIDLYGAADQTANPTSYRVATTGTAPNRVCTIQFKNLRDYATATVPAQFATMQFQIRLFEGTNNIELVYGTWTATTNTPLGHTAVIGIKGTGTAVADRVLALKPSSSTPWSTTVFAQPANIAAHFIRNTFLPDAGRTYRFEAGPPLPANDAAVQVIYSLGKAPASSPQVVQALVRNAGSAALTNVAVTLNVTGANTFTDAKIIPTLAAGASTTVSFNAFTPTATGNNTLAVSVPADAGNTNNSQTYTQVVTANTFSYANNTPLDPNLGVGFTAPTTGAFVAKFTTPAARTITAVAAGLTDPNSVGRTVYSVVVNASGAVLGRSADYVVQTADINALKTLPLQTAVAAPAGNFYVGLVQTAAPTGAARYFPMATQPEAPTRPATFFTIAPFAANGGALVDAAASNLGAFVLDAQTSIVQGTSEALNRAISMYPNPSTGLVKLDVRGANAKGNLQVSVVNMLGQTVHTAALKDNFTNEVNLSGLANGMYLLKVQTGADYTVRQLTITK